MSQLLFNAAVAEFEAGRFESSARLSRSALESNPGNENVLTLLAISLQAIGQFAGAADAFAALAQARPDVGEYRANRGVMLRHLKRYDEAEAEFKQALTLPHAVDGTLINYGLLLLDMGRVAEARHCFLDACELGDLPEARIYAALACIDCGDTRRAQSLIPPHAWWPALDPSLRRDLTKALIQLGQVEDAENLLTADARTGDPLAILRLATLHERTNRIDSARSLLEQVRTEVATDAEMEAEFLSLDSALALRAKDYDRARRSTRALLQLSGLPPAAKANAHFVMAKVADKQGAVDEAMAELAQAHAIQFALASASLPEVAESPDEPLRIASRWMTPEQTVFAVSPNAPSRAESPVFIVGFPRSGTTMLEQMLDAHPAFVSMDERIIIQYCVECMESKGLTYPHELDRLSDADLAELRELYWAESSKVADIAPGSTLVDKNPLNLLRLPMIRRLFPDARVILALRHPCDVILSCYMQNFRSPAFMVLCSTLERLAKSYVNAMRFWIHHQPLLCPDALLLRYEETVSDFASQVDVIADYLGIADRAPLSDFAAHAAGKKYISTPSYAQVIEPVNARAVARWQPYRAYFEPLFPLLEPIASHWGYALDGGEPCTR
ncbi:sulfotransferase [Cognatiluteimonas profundi]|uniref:sulfotransferase n=1 Tax=Cognatiluteimonas profundi TaxID=2594501 RepID=UPI00131A920E|nr:sulfotransferase [Lysobacter profundi]